LALTDEIQDDSDVAFDTNAVVYYVENNARYLSQLAPLFVRLSAGAFRGHVSVITLLEVLVKPFVLNDLNLAEKYRSALIRSESMSLHLADVAVSERAAEIRARLNLSVADSLVASTAIEFGCSHIVVNDSAFRRVNGINVLFLDDFV
jgi:predicted nucleic acid-binding protein